jgi:hypothetical protein
VAGLPDFEADGLWRGGYPRFGTRPVPLSSVDTLACDLRPAPDAARHPSQAREERSMHLVQHGSIFTHSPSL